MDKRSDLKLNLKESIAESKVINTDSVDLNHPKPDMTADREKLFEGQELGPHRVVELEMSVNSHFKNWDPLLNLKKLKSRVHQIIKGKKDDSSNANTRAERMAKLGQLIKSLQGDEGSFILGEGSKLSAFEVDSKSRKIYLGFKDGKLAIIDLNSERPSPNKENTHLISCIIFDLKSNSGVEDIFLIDEEELLIVFKDQISVLFVDFEDKDRIEDYELDLCLLFHNILDAGTEHQIKEVRFLPQHKMFYLMIEHGKESRMFIRFKIEGDSKIEMYRKVFPKLVSKFEVHHKNPDLLYLIVKNEVHKLDISRKEEEEEQIGKNGGENSANGVQSLINMPKSMTYFDFSLRETSQKASQKRREKRKKKQMGRTKQKPFFNNPKKDILFFKFDPSMKYFFCNEGRFVKKYQTESKKLVETFESHQHDLKNIEFSENFEFMFSLDEKGIIKVWNLKRSFLMSTLNQKGRYKGFKNLAYIEQNEQLIARHRKGLAFWNLKKTFPNYWLPGVDIGGCSLLLSEDGTEMWFDQDEESLRQVEFGKGMKELKAIQFHEEMLKKQFLSSGDYLEVRRDEIFSEAQSEAERDEQKEQNEFFLEDINEDSDDQFTGNESKGKEKKFGVWYKLVYVPVRKMLELDENKYNRQNYHLQNEKKEIVLYTSKKQISCFTAISSLGLSKPKIMDNGKVKASPMYVQEKLRSRGAADFLEVRFGTEDGNCLMAELLFDAEGELISNDLEEVVDEFLPPNLSTSVVFNSSKGKSRGIDRSQYNTASKELHTQISISLSKMTWPMNDFAKFPDVDVEAYVFIENRGSSDPYGPLDIFLCVLARQSASDWAKIEIRLESEIGDSKESKFSLKQMDSVARDERYIRFAAYGLLGIVALEFDTTRGTLSVLGFVEKNLKVEPRYSEKQDSFFIPLENSVMMYDGSLSFLSHTIETEYEVKALYLIEGPQEKLFIYDRVFYYEFEIGSLRFQKKTRIFPIDSIIDSQIPFNFKMFTPGEVFKVPHLGQEVNEISFTPDVEPLDLHRFPFEALLKCLKKEDYEKPILEFAEYYFAQISLTNSDDLYYGPMNPLLFAIYHNNIDLIELLLEKYQYPKSVRDYWTPISFAFRFNYQSCIKALCEKLTGRKYDISFTRQDFTSLLKSKKAYCESLVATIPSQPAVVNFPKLVYMHDRLKLYYVKDVDQLLITLKQHEDRIEQKKTQKQNKKAKEGQTRERRKSMKEIYRKISLSEGEDELLTAEELAVKANLGGIKETKKEIVVYQLPFLYDFKVGSDDSIRFLNTYSNSSNEEFVTSQWKELIKSKWKSHRLVHVTFALVYFMFTITSTVFLVFRPSNIIVSEVFTLIFMIVLMVFEFTQMISYFFFSFSEYMADFWNYIDWSIFILFFIFIFGEHHENESQTNQALAPIILVLIYYRNFSHLRVINQFTTFVGMINIIIQKLSIFFLIMLYFYLATAFLMIRVLPEQDNRSSFEFSYLWTLFGAIEKDDFESSSYSVIAIVFGTLIVTIILLNILIAYLSNVFSRLEEQQNVNDLKEKAGMILDMEIISWFFKIKITGKIKKLKQLEEDQNDTPVFVLSRDKSRDSEISEEERKMIDNRRRLFIIKSVGADDEDDDGHDDTEKIIVQKMKVFTAKFDHFVTRYEKGQEKMENELRGLQSKLRKK